MSNNKELPEDIREKIEQATKGFYDSDSAFRTAEFGYHLRDSEVEAYEERIIKLHVKYIKDRLPLLREIEKQSQRINELEGKVDTIGKELDEWVKQSKLI